MKNRRRAGRPAVAAGQVGEDPGGAHRQGAGSGAEVPGKLVNLAIQPLPTRLISCTYRSSSGCIFIWIGIAVVKGSVAQADLYQGEGGLRKMVSYNLCNPLN